MRMGKQWKRLLSIILAASVINTTLCSSVVTATGNPQSGDSVVYYDAGNNEEESLVQDNEQKEKDTSSSADSTETAEANGKTDAPETSETDSSQSAESSDGDKKAYASMATDSNNNQKDKNGKDISGLYENSQIKIYNFDQLKAVGTGAEIHEGDIETDTFGTGDVLTDEEGNALTYAADGTYKLMNDIALDSADMWQLPDGFAGTFDDAEVTEDAPLYDAETDTIYVYHQYQLATINDPEALKTVMSKDMIAKDFGVGQVVYADADQTVQLEYTDEHNYVVSKDFTEEMPELTATEVQADVTDQQGGRDFVGQVYEEIDGKTYILIGNEYQLREIGKGTQVTPMLYVRTIADLGSLGGKKYYYTPYYPGDADYNLRSGDAIGEDGISEQNFLYFADENTEKNDGLMHIEYDKEGLVTGLLGPLGDLLSGVLRTLLGPLFDIPLLGSILKAILGGKRTDDIVIVDKEFNQENAGGFVSVANASDFYKNLKYTSDANYIIFRDINLAGTLDNITDGNGDGQDTPWDPIMLSGDMLGQKNMDPNTPVTISNINVATGETLEAANHIGVGFFGTISGQRNADNIGKVAPQTLVKNINLSGVTIQNNADELQVDRSLIDALLTGVGSLLGGLLGGIEDILGAIIQIPGLGNLNLGETIQKLLTLKSDDPDTYATGSFAGRVTGNVKIENCQVTNASVSNIADITGGFAGFTEGVEEYDGLSDILGSTVNLLSKLLNIIPGVGLGDLIELLLENDVNLGQLIPTGYYKPEFENCSVALSGNAGTVGTAATSYNGGFVGVQTGTKMNSCTVSGLTAVNAKNFAGGFAGLERDDTLQGALTALGIELAIDVQSVQTNCKVDSAGLTVTAEENYAGGFNGCMANSISETGTLTDLDKVTANQDYAGGYTGRATIGSALALADGNLGEQDGTLIGSVSKLLGTVATGEATGTLLQTIGVHGAEIRNYNIGGSDIIIEAKRNYAGGLVGSGDGTIIENSSADSSPKLNLQNVSAGSKGVEGKYAGGVAGALTTANGAGLLNEVVGLVDVQEYKASNINVDVKSVTATGDYAGGAFGLLTGGKVDHVAAGAVETVTANNYAGGFVGRSGVGSLVDAKGLDILGLGAVEVGNLVSIGNLTSVDIKNSTVTGNNLTVSATGNTEGNDYFAGGFVSENNSGKIADSSVTGLRRVFTETTGYFWGDEDKLATSYAGGFAARSQVGGLANVGADGDTVGGLLGEDGLVEIDGLLDAIGYLIPSYTNCFVEFTDRDFNEAQVSAAVAGGFIGEMQGGTIDNRGLNTENKEYAVRNAEYIEGTYYAGGFAGKILSGGLAQSDGLSLLGTHIDVSGLLNLIPTYIPKVYSAGVQSSANGLRVYASESDDVDVDSGSAGGYVGLTSGARISNSIVKELATKTEGTDAAPKENDYAVKAPRFAGGYVGKAEIGSAAAVGQSLDLLGTIEIGSLTSAIAAVESKFEGCDVYGKAGGFNVNSTEGSAGGYAGVVGGSNFNDSDSYNFEYIKGVTSAGGYAGMIQPGDVASLAESTEVLGGLLSVDNLLQVAQTFIARIWNSETTAVPCGGYVIATGTSDGANLRGLAGGYAGYNLGGQIKGEYACDPIFEDNSFTQKTAAAIRIRSVEGEEFAGGFTGLMEAANVAETGNLKLLWGLVTADNLLQAVSAVYPTEENTKVTGPLDSMSLDVWNSWVDAVGSSGAYGDIFTEHRTFDTDEKLNDFLEDYIYGYTVKANAKDDTMTGVDAGGSAGGYVGRMEGGVITNGHAQDLKSVEAYRSAGGFAGEMVTGTIADLGNLSVGNLDVADGLGIVQTFVPVIYTSKVEGYSSGFTVESTAEVNNTSIGNAGGFVGYADGAQIFDNKDGKNAVADPNAKAAVVTDLRTVTGHKNVGGFAGIMQAGAALGADVTSSSGLLNQILGHLISQDQVSNLVNVLQATRTVVDSAEVTGYMPANEGGNAKPVFSVVGDKGEKADFAGGFAGKLTGALIGDESSETKDSVVITGLKSVAGGKHVGGFFGLADVDGLVEVAEDSETSILGLIGLGNVDVLNAFRTYIYSATVNGAENSGLSIYANERTGSGISGVIDDVISFFSGKTAADQTEKDGNAGGFGGSLKDSSVVNCAVNNLNRVNALTYAGGFIGFTGKSGVVDADNVGVLDKLLGASAGVADIFGSQVKDSNVNGSDKTGYIIRSKDGEECIAGGFIGYGDLARVDNCHAKALKQVYSDQIAGGFIGKTSFAYLAEVDAGSNALLNPILSVVNQLLKYLYLDDLQNIGLIQITLPEPFDKVLNLEVLNDNNVLSVTLLGLRISVGLVKGDGTTSDVAQIHIGDSYIEVECHDDPEEQNYISNDANISIGLIKANRTRVGDSSVSGITIGYDVFGGGAGNEKDGTHDDGYAGGFVGYNDEGLFEDNNMYQADTIRGSKDHIGEFSGTSSLNSNYTTLKDIEGNNNQYFVYRLWDEDNLTKLFAKDGTTEITRNELNRTEKVTIDRTDYYRYPVLHMQYETYKHDDLWQDAYQTTANNTVQFPVNVYVSAAQADLMLGTPVEDNISDPDKSEGAMQDPCDDYATLTIQKIWYDNNNEDGERPENITVTVTQDGNEYNPGSDDGWNKPITMNAGMATTDSNVWTKTVKVPVNKESTEGQYEKYTYEVSEEDLSSKGYITIYGKSSDGYTLYIYNYRIDEMAQKDTVVIDYGLPVDIDVLTNDKMTEAGVTDVVLEGISKRSEENILDSGVTAELEDGFTKAGKTAAGKFGSAQILTGSKESGSDPEMIGKQLVRYTPSTMQMDSYEKLLYAVHLKDHVKNNQNYVYGELDIIPATEIYYEDDFNQTHNEQLGNFTTGINYVDGNGEGEAGKWEETDPDSTASQVQDTDRPGSDVIGRAWDDYYGNDSHYEDDLKFSNGSSHYVMVNESNLSKNGGTYPTAEFTFTGTGFDVISVTSGATGVVKVSVFNSEDKLEKSYTVDTYYSYKYEKVDGSGQWIQIDENIPEEEEDDNALYQVPIVKITGLDYGTHKVVITPQYSKNFDHHYKEDGTNSYTLYLDAIRIYNPALDPKNENPDYVKISDVYKQDGEQEPRFIELRDLLLNAKNVTETPVAGTVFVDGNAESNLQDSDGMAIYEANGPANEVYLDKGHAISFYLWSDYIPDKIQLSAKLAQGDMTNLTIALAVKENPNAENTNDQWKYYRVEGRQITTAHDMYYDFADKCIWEEVTSSDGAEPFRKYRTKYPIVIANMKQNDDTDSDVGILSLTNLQWTGENGDGVDIPDQDEKSIQSTGNSNELMAMSSWDNVEAAYYFLNDSAQHTVTVNYVDQDGKKLSDSTVITGVDGSEYDMSDAAGKVIEGYEIAEIQGEVTGTLDSDVEITVIYQPKTYTLRVEYVDQAGLTLADPYVQDNIAHGTEYDVTAQTEKEIEGYRLVGTAGGFLQGTMENDVTIRVIYEKQTFDLTVYYIDGEGNEIADPYIWENVAYGTAYDLTEQTEKQIDGYTLQQVSGDEATGILSGDVVIHVVYAKTEAAVPMTYTVLVRYTDKEGNSLADPYFIKDLEKGSAYDVEAQTEKEIDGYTFCEIKGDAVSGEADCNKVITVVYLKNYSIQLNYKDQDGNVLADPYMTEAPEGSHYDLSEQTEKKFEGYQLVGTAGGFIEGRLESDLTINVIYEKLTYSIIVNYVDQDGNVLADPYVKTEVPYGTAYDVSEMTDREIDGYATISVTGDPDKGTVSGNVILNVVYEKEQAEEPKPTYSVIVNYIDKNGNVLAQPYVQAGLTEGSSYDVTAETEKQIDGYTLAEIKGDVVSGTADSNRVINVVYLQNYTVTVTYEGNDGKVLADPYVITGTDGSAYDVTEQTQRQFEGYSLDRIAGDDVSGVLDQNKEIRVEYLQQTFSITVFYKDRAGNDLAEPYIKADVPYGTAYDVTAEADKEIDGYEAADICGSPVTGTVTQPVAITVIYDKKEAEQPEKPVTYSVVVNYLDKSGNALAESYVQDNVAEGTKYNVSLQAGRFIGGYTLAGVIGDAVYGTVDGNKVINVIYLKNYQVTVRYLDEDNNDLVDSYVYEAVEGSIYNVSQHAALEIEGYELDELRGQPVWGILDDNKIVIVKYTKAEETPAPGGDDQNPTDPDDSDEQEPTEPDDPEDQKPSEPENPDDQQPLDPDKQDPAETEDSDSQGSSDQGKQDVQNPADSNVNDTVDKLSSGIENADAQDSNNSAAETDRAVETGDTSNIFLPVTGMAIALLAVAAVVIYRKRNMKK